MLDGDGNQRVAGVVGLGSQSFFLNCILCSQGRDASDQHIVDVVLKMIQGEGRAAAPPHSPLQYPVTLHQPLHVSLLESLEFPVCIPTLPPQTLWNLGQTSIKQGLGKGKSMLGFSVYKLMGQDALSLPGSS